MKYALIHLKYENPRWIVYVEQEEVARSHHFTQGAAIETGRSLARRLDTDLIVHDADGQIVEFTSFRFSSLLTPIRSGAATA